MIVETDVDNRPMPLMVDPELLHRALSNLVLNAKDAMPEGGIVTISAHPKGEAVELRVADTGQGMTPEECEPPVHSVLHDEAARDGIGTGDCAVGCSGPCGYHNG